MRVTGWTPAVLRAQPASVVRAHFARIFAGLAWDPELAAAASGPTPGREAFAHLGDWASARAYRGKAQEALASVTAALWPEDDDRG